VRDAYVFKSFFTFKAFLYELTGVSGIGKFKRDADGKIMRDELDHPIMEWGTYWFPHGLRKFMATTGFHVWGWSVDEIAIRGYWTHRETLIEDYIYGYHAKVSRELRLKIKARYTNGTEGLI